MLVSGVRSSWPTMPKNSVRSRSRSASGPMSCTGTTTESAASPSVVIGVALTKVVSLRSPGNSATISSARTASPVRSSLGTGSSLGGISRPSELQNVAEANMSFTGEPGELKSPAIRRASRFADTNSLVSASNTRTPTAAESTSASKWALARRSSRWRRALEITRAA